MSGTVDEGAPRRPVLVTGTSAGIGQATVRLLAARGFFVYANVRDPGQMARWDGVEHVRALCFDVRSDEEVAAARDLLRAAGVALYGIVNNAGISNWGPILDIPDAFTRDNFETNVLGPIRVTRTFLPLLDRAGARIVNISSISGRLIFPFMGPYHMAKAALEAFSDSLRRELMINELGQIRVAIIEPGSVKTRLWDRAESTTVFSESSVFHATALTIGRAIIAEEKAKAFPPERVSAAVLRALTARRPKVRYMVSPDSPFFRVLLALPARWLDRLACWIMRRHLPRR